MKCPRCGTAFRLAGAVVPATPSASEENVPGHPGRRPKRKKGSPALLWALVGGVILLMVGGGAVLAWVLGKSPGKESPEPNASGERQPAVGEDNGSVPHSGPRGDRKPQERRPGTSDRPGPGAESTRPPSGTAEKPANDPRPKPPPKPTDEGPPKDAVTLTIDNPETAGISAFRALWDTPIVLDENGATEVKDRVVKNKWLTAAWSPQKRRSGQPAALAFDALNRSALVRFPVAAEKIAAQVSKGYAIHKVELVLPFKDTELWPPGDQRSCATPDGYTYRTNWGCEEFWKHKPPRWHAVAWALRKPWMADPEISPTFNAFINGSGYWTRYGAQNESRDRHARRFGPTEVSYRQTNGRMDVTATLTDAEFGKSLRERLRSLADNGFLLKKGEIYDHHYYHEVYEWATATGGRAILTHAPRLVVTLTPTTRAESVDNLPPPANVQVLVRSLAQSREGGRPTAVLPDKEQLQKWAAQADSRPAWMPEWQYAHVRQLDSLAFADRKPRPFWYDFADPVSVKLLVGRPVYDKPSRTWVRVATPEQIYEAWVDTLLSKQPRGWSGFEAAKEMTQWYTFHHAMPGPARDHVRLVWTGWLMPDRPARELEHPMADKLTGKPVTDKDFVDSYVARTGDWRGDKSFYRDGFCYVMSTQNFNQMASTGALLGGALIDSKYAIEDGRHGVEMLPLRTFTWNGGSSQEDIDHYYFPVTLSNQKAVADFGPTRFDRLMGTSMLTKSMDEIVSAYHPHLRRFIAGSNRTSLERLLVTQDGLHAIMHTLIPDGALHDLDNRGVPGNMPVLGHEFQGAVIARQALTSPWAPPWAANKPLPYEVTSSGNGAWQRTYLGQHYGLASQSQGWRRIQVMGQWRRSPKLVENMEDVGTLICRYGLNRTRFANNAPGWIAEMGQQAVLQHRNKMLVVANPCPTDWLKEAVAKEGLRSLQSSIALYNYQATPDWEIYVDGRRVESLPFKARQGQRITIKDGVTYLGIIPLPATDLGRSDEVILREGEEQTFERMKFRPALVIDSFNLQRDSASPAPSAADYQKLQKSYGGFVVELADETEYKDFTTFQQHLRDSKLSTRWDPARSTLKVAYASGEDTLEGTFQALASVRSLADPKVNGHDVYLPPGLMRDTTLSQQGNTGRLSKNGAVLTTARGITTYLHTDPVTDTYTALNPMPFANSLSLGVPGGVTVEADGLLGLAKVTVRPKENKLWVDYAAKPGQKDLAKALLVSGLSNDPVVVRNGKAVTDRFATKDRDGKRYHVIPLPEEQEPDTSPER